MSTTRCRHGNITSDTMGEYSCSECDPVAELERLRAELNLAQRDHQNGIDACRAHMCLGSEEAKQALDSARADNARLRERFSALLKAAEDAHHGLATPIGIARLRLQGTDFDKKFGDKACAVFDEFGPAIGAAQKALAATDSREWLRAKLTATVERARSGVIWNGFAMEYVESTAAIVDGVMK